jgi:hypothetical protein
MEDLTIVGLKSADLDMQWICSSGKGLGEYS